ncbi:MAG: TDP-N-acetylfucosamine:lipid II N-acetylfucosaminyltransferase [Ekhidna sp.]|uniref:TDP-N-acetylfucosamine:lipid II N-acetylfucosaminyltransferase n=1 Tax=Ekhidna sp. TaxID=2608089 RepID=UPI0032EB6448
MILHLHTDSRFADYTISLFDQKDNHHLVGKRYPGQRLKYISNHQNTEQYVFGWTNPKRLLKKLSPGAVIVHFLDIRWFELIRELPTDVRVVWIFWGGDGYGLPKMKEGLLDPITASFASKLGSHSSKVDKMKAELGVDSIWQTAFWKSLVFEGVRKMKTTASLDTIRLKLFERVDYCGTFLKEDYKLLKAHYDFKMDWVDARFISLEQLIGSLEPVNPEGNNILLGNSCTMENNHVDAFEAINQLELIAGQQVICPLSYGKDMGSYRDLVIEEGNQKLGQSFSPLMELMSINEYTKVLRSCSYAIMFHNRQQAFNNILALVYLGVKVYLKPSNTIYTYLRRIGCEVCSTEELRATKELKPLNEDEILRNREALRKEFSQKMIRKSANSLLEKLT